MANYPTLPLDADSSMEPIDMGKMDITGAGPRLRYLSSVELFEFRVKHSFLTQAQAESVYDLWSGDKTATVTLAWRDGDSYDCKWDGPPEKDKDFGAERWWAKARLIGALAP